MCPYYVNSRTPIGKVYLLAGGLCTSPHLDVHVHVYIHIYVPRVPYNLP